MANWRGSALRFCEVAGLPILEPFVRLIAGEDPREQLKGNRQIHFAPDRCHRNLPVRLVACRAGDHLR